MADALPKYIPWLALGVPLAGLLELGAHFIQTHRVVPESDWLKAKEAVASVAKPDDLVIFAPRWIEPVGNEHLDEAMTIPRAAFADVSRFPRAVEVASNGASRRELNEWKTTEERTLGSLKLRVRENPRYRPVLTDLVTRLEQRKDIAVDVLSGGDASPCSFVNGGSQTGGLGFGTAVPGRRFQCAAGSFAGSSIVTDLDYFPHRCIYAPPPSAGKLSIRFPNTTLGDSVSGHHALYVEAERHRVGVPVTLSVSFGDESIGTARHVDGEGWKGFEFPTGPLKGKTGELVFSISAENNNRRAYCFEAVIL